MTPTPQQSAFYATATARRSIALKARAGTGKTQCEQEWAKRTRSNGISTSSSKGTTQELDKKMPRNFPAHTVHSLCLSAIRLSGKYVKTVDSHPFSPQNKLFSLTKETADKLDLPWEVQSPARALVALAKTYGIIPKEIDRPGLQPDIRESWESLADQYDIEFSEEILYLARTTLNRSIHLSLDEGYHDFDDMLYIATLWPHRFVRHSTVIVDEAQDLSLIQTIALSKILLPKGQLIAAGDDRQAIYGFRGALADSYSVLINKFDMQEMPLTVSFRCPRAVIREAQRYVPDIEPAPGAREGDVIRHESRLSLSKIPRAIICRNNAPLISLALKLLVSGRTAEVSGREIGKGLIALTKRITRKNLKSEEFIPRLHRWAAREISRRPQSQGKVEDKCAALEELAKHHKDLQSTQKHLEQLYPNPRSKYYRPAEVHLSTIHKAKGKEWPEVLFLDQFLIPSKYATQKWKLMQESNLAYVGVTRAQQILHYANSNLIGDSD